jgi:hypothetical protein
MDSAPAAHPSLARAYLALCDDPEPAPDQRSLPRVALALLAAVVLACAAPLAWVSGEPHDAPAATSVKAAGLADDDGGEDDDGDAGDPWAATIA